ncbi:MAG: endonuclease/exonuclease/phosphatase family protein [Bacteroidales bacterium]|nr:endonuclease/exonuclease/phosphatase family protein [Bacteroidales bacterium]
MRKFISTSILIINVIFAVLLLISTLAGIIKPSACVWISLLSYCYVPLLLINIGFILFWLFFANKYFLVSLVTIIVRYSFVPLYIQLSGNEHITDDRHFRIMTFNVHRFTKEDDACVQTIGLVKENIPNVICFQEFAAMPGKVNVYDSLRRQGYNYNYSHIRKNKQPRGTSIFSKYPIIKAGNIDSTRCIYVDVKTSFDTIRIYNIHLSSYRLDEEDRNEIDRIKHGDMTEKSKKTLHKFKTTAGKHQQETDILLKHIANSPYKTIMCGDFNDTPASYVYQKMKDIYTDSYVAKGKGLSTTYNGIFPAFRIDYILHHNDFVTDSYRRIKTNISDHYPILVSIQTTPLQ